jgi:hypothetical protein
MFGLDINYIVQIFALVLLLTYITALVVLLVTQWNNNDIRTIVTKQMKVFVLFPAGGLFALLIVALFQQAAGPITLETGGLKFQGASGPIIFWLLCMLLIIYGINKLWEK